MRKIDYFKIIYKSILQKRVKQATIISIDVQCKGDQYISKIKLCSRGHIFWASKSAFSVNESLRKTTQAVFRQVDKVYTRFEKKELSMMYVN